MPNYAETAIPASKIKTTAKILAILRLLVIALPHGRQPNMLKRNVTPLVLMVLVLLTIFISVPPSAQLECKGECEWALERCLSGALDRKRSFDPDC